MGGGVKFYTKDATGAEIKDVVRCLVEGYAVGSISAARSIVCWTDDGGY